MHVCTRARARACVGANFLLRQIFSSILPESLETVTAKSVIVVHHKLAHHPPQLALADGNQLHHGVFYPPHYEL